MLFSKRRKPYIPNAKPISCPWQMHDQISQARICTRMIAKKTGEKNDQNQYQKQGNSILRCKEIWRKRSRTHLNDILLMHNLIGLKV